MSPPTDRTAAPGQGTAAQKVTSASHIVPLTPAEQEHLDHLEGVIERGLDTFVQVGNALALIHGERLYRQTHTSWEKYLKDRFDISRSYAYRVIDAAKVATEVSSIGDIKSEAVARELVGLDVDVQREVFSAVIETTGTETPTAAEVREVREQIVPAMTKPMRRRPLPDAHRDLVRTLTKTVESLERLHADDRFHANRQALAGESLGWFHRARGALHGLMMTLDDDVANEAAARNAVLVANGWSDPDSIR